MVGHLLLDDPGMLQRTIPFSVATSIPSTVSMPIEEVAITRQRVRLLIRRREIRPVKIIPSTSRAAAMTPSSPASWITETLHPAFCRTFCTSGRRRRAAHLPRIDDEDLGHRGPVHVRLALHLSVVLLSRFASLRTG